jgi:hypothetical protein
MVGVSAASFYRLSTGTLIVLCVGSFPHRALPLIANVGDIDVRGISISPDGLRFTGVLPRTPNAGDELVVRFLPEPPTRTGFRFPSAASLPVA